MVDLNAFSPFLLFLLVLPLLTIIFIRKLSLFNNHETLQTSRNVVKSYSALCVPAGKDLHPWLAKMLEASPTSTIVIKMPLWRGDRIVTANPANVEHILKTKFSMYKKSDVLTTIMGDLFGKGMFLMDGDEWKFQRKVASHEFNSKSIRKFVEEVVDAEIENRLVPIIAESAVTGSVLDLQDILRRFAFDNICKISFEYDPEVLLPSLPESRFSNAFDEAIALSNLRHKCLSPMVWRMKRFLNIGSERRLRDAIGTVREFATIVIKQKKSRPETDSDLDQDLLSRFLKLGHSDERLMVDITINFILAGRDTTSAGLTWFFWLLSKNPRVEREILEEMIRNDEKDKKSSYEEAREMVYLHAALHESMRLYPPVASDTKQAAVDDVLPDGTVVRKGTIVRYHVYGMGRMERIWGEDWPIFRPERWLTETRDFVGKDPFSYPVFQAGPRMCLGKEMAIMQMKRVAAATLRHFKVLPMMDDESFHPVLISQLTTVMVGGFPVKFVRRLS